MKWLLAICNFIFINIYVLSQDIVPPVIKRVHVIEETNNVIVEWEPSTSANIKQYNIMRRKNEFDNIVLGNTAFNVTFFTDVNSGADLASKSYGVEAENISGNRSRISDQHRTIYLKHFYDSCNSSVKLNWTRYYGWISGVNKYKVYKKLDGVVSPVAETADTFSIITGLQPNKNYLFYIVGVSNGTPQYLSGSNTIRFNSYLQSPPSYLKASYLLNNETSVNLEFSIDNNSQIDSFRVIRTNVSTGANDFIRMFGRSNNNYTLTDSNPDKLIFRYKIAAVNTCRQEVKESNPITVLFLNVNTEENGNRLSYNNHEQFDGNQVYKIYRIIDGVQSLIHTSDNQAGYTDQRNSIPTENQEGKICYRVECEGNDNEKSVSNTACIMVTPIAVMPDIFNPESSVVKNRTFGPVMNQNPEKMNMEILDLNGKPVFKSDRYDIFWDGKNIQGNDAPAGQYLYQVTILFYNGTKVEKSGILTLIRK